MLPRKHNKLNNVFELTPSEEAELMDNTIWYWDIPPNYQWNAPLGIIWYWDDVKEIYEYHKKKNYDE